MPKMLLLTVAFTVIILTAFFTLYFNRDTEETLSKSEIDTVTNQAKFLYRQRKERGEDFSSGPCLSNSVMQNWVADIVHKPRIPADDLPQNMCPAFLEGRAQHFVELDKEGNFVRAK
ncbi:hypothetical protein HYS95_01980 [Candidatus Daviesbacteria bacterium]|nr:hypothetical protein [Candidatus Daviesbacteria bacterium]